MIRRLFVMILVIGSAITSSQLSEFAQQYRQRLGGALGELEQVAKAFDRDAEKLKMTRTTALIKLSSSPAPLVQKRGLSMKQTFQRYASLQRQHQQFNALGAPMRPVALFSAYDPIILNGAWNDYQAAIPINIKGAIWAAVGAVSGWLASLILLLPFGGSARRRTTKPGRREPMA